MWQLSFINVPRSLWTLTITSNISFNDAMLTRECERLTTLENERQLALTIGVLRPEYETKLPSKIWTFKRVYEHPMLRHTNKYWKGRIDDSHREDIASLALLKYWEMKKNRENVSMKFCIRQALKLHWRAYKRNTIIRKVMRTLDENVNVGQRAYAFGHSHRNMNNVFAERQGMFDILTSIKDKQVKTWFRMLILGYSVSELSKILSIPRTSLERRLKECYNETFGRTV